MTAMRRRRPAVAALAACGLLAAAAAGEWRLALAQAGAAAGRASASVTQPGGPGARADAALLNSERIEAAFGSYGIEVLQSDAATRISDLYSTDRSGERTTRTLALVRYPSAVLPAFAAEHAAILDGGSIGATFKARGWTVVKSHLHFGARAASASVRDMMRLRAATDLAVHVYALDVVRGDLQLRYATILEMHHPDYLTAEQVRLIYAPDWSEASNADIRPLLDRLTAGGY